MKSSRNTRNEQNYKNFGYSLLGILLLIVLIGFVGFVGYLDGKADTEYSYAYEAGRIFGRSLRNFIDYFILSGVAYGSIFAFFASREKKNSFPIALIHALFGWAYVIYYSLTRKRQYLQ